MRTKSILLGAAVLAAGVASSMAANVYSVNVVGYINLTLYPGFNLLANQLDVDGTNRIGTVLNNANANPAGIDGLECLTMSNGLFKVDYYDGTASVLNSPGWYDNVTTVPSTNSIPPGVGFFIYNQYSTNIILTLAGTVKQGTNSQLYRSGFTIGSTIAPQAVTLDTTATNNFPAVDSMEYLAWTNTGHGGAFATPDFYDATMSVLNVNGWYDNVTTLQVFPTPAVGAAFFLYNPSTPQTWSRNFQVQ